MNIEKLKMPVFTPNYGRPHVREVMKKTTFLDIETSLIKAYTFRTGMQRINIDQMVEGDQTRLLTAAWGSWYDLFTKGASSVVSVSNHHKMKTFKKDPLDDTYVLSKLWHVLDKSDVIVAHNAAFDRGWIEGRFMDLGWRQPSKYYVYCTFRALHGLNGNSKKLDYLSQKLIGTKKVANEGMPLWIRCNEGDVEAFKLMEEYNIGDIYDTLYQVFMRTASYVPRHKCIDLAGEGLYCNLTGDPLVKLEDTYRNRINGLHYYKYINPTYGFTYRDRYNINSKKSDQGYIRPLISNGAY